MSLVKQISYLAIEASDLAAWRVFATEVLGLTLSSETPSGFNLRLDRYQNRFFLTAGPSDDVTAIGFEVADEGDLMSLKARLEEAGTTVQWGSDALKSSRGVKNLICCQDPSGVPLEFSYGPALATTPFHSPKVPAGFLADDQGFGHVVISCKSQEADRAFYLDTLGFRLSDTMHLKFGPMEFQITFTHINPRHHSLAFSGPMPKKIHHFMLQARAIDEVGQAYDRARNHKVVITQELGRHANDKMFSFYAKTPSGFEFEYGADAIEIDDTIWVPAVYDRGSDWGHRRPQALKP